MDIPIVEVLVKVLTVCLNMPFLLPGFEVINSNNNNRVLCSVFRM